MDIVAVVVSIVSAAVAAISVAYARRSAQSAESSAVSAKTTAALDVQRRNVELTPRFRATCTPLNPGTGNMRRLVLTLVGPPELQRLDALTVRIRDDHPWRAEGTPLAGGPTPEQIADQIWGPYRFTPGTGPGADPARGVPGADRTGRSSPTSGLPVGEGLPFQLEPTLPPSWSQQSPQDWSREQGMLVRLSVECRRDGWEPWTLPCELDASTWPAVVEFP